ncbi:ATP-dependent helicase [Romboutsia sp. MSSM.1001216sp_RTP31141st1_G3_RTP31141_220114]|uniref:ATP-dependent helicase n=1 Tax=Romboutsia sp. MSSM.1001216sp_RTP31141st1_G3_RTP31141_220114 TaxID=3141595 RepID=UPI0031B61DCB
MTLDDLFGKSGFKPNKAQEEAIKTIDGPLNLVAGPGSGKTRVLLWRVVNLIVFNNVNPEEIYLSTFTEKAAQQLKDGLISLLAIASQETGINYDISKMYVGTVHSLCQRLITNRKLKNRLKNKAPKIMQELEQYFYIKDKLLKKAKIELGFSDDNKQQIKSYMYLRSIGANEIVNCLMSVFNRFSEECIEPDEIINDYRKDEVLILFGKLYKLYIDSLKQDSRDIVDLSLLQKYTYDILCNNDDSENIFKYIIIDEYQDTNSIQEKIFFKLASGHKNICVVGDDDQSLYRFRGARVENFVQFSTRSESYLGKKAKTIKLSTNYRSRKDIVDYYTRFIEKEDWENKNNKGQYYRNNNKKIVANSNDNKSAVVRTHPSSPEEAFKEIAEKVRFMLDEKIINDPSEVSVLFTYLRDNSNVGLLRKAFEQVGINVYAPRAKKFFDNEEPMLILGLIGSIFGLPVVDEEYNKGVHKEFNEWIEKCVNMASELIKSDEKLADFIQETCEEIQDLKSNYSIIAEYMKNNNLHYDDALTLEEFEEFRKNLSNELSNTGIKEINKPSLRRIVKRKLEEENNLTYKWLITRINSLDWNLLDLFYKLCGFDRFKIIFDNAEKGIDEGPMYNLSSITTYLQFFIENKFSLISGKNLVNSSFRNIFFTSYIGSLYKREEGEYEMKDEPIPKGRVSFLTIHQSKGLEFPVVILGNVVPVTNSSSVKKSKKMEEMVRPYLDGDYEPLDKIAEFDKIRCYYVAISRAEKLLILPHLIGKGKRTHAHFKCDFESGKIPFLSDLDMNLIPKSKIKLDNISKVYSYTADYLAYNDCPRKYMIYRKYNFVPARTTISFFGNLVHKTLEDLHNYYIDQKERELV